MFRKLGKDGRVGKEKTILPGALCCGVIRFGYCGRVLNGSLIRLFGKCPALVFIDLRMGYGIAYMLEYVISIRTSKSPSPNPNPRSHSNQSQPPIPVHERTKRLTHVSQ